MSSEFIDNFFFLPGLKSSCMEVKSRLYSILPHISVYKTGSQVAIPESLLLLVTVGMHANSREKTS